MIDYIILAVILVIAGLASLYVIRQKKKGAKCIGCPYAQSCNSQCNCDK